MASPRVLHVGLCTVDLVQRVSVTPRSGEKVQSSSAELTAGGPATNAAVTGAALGGSSVLLTGLGSHPLAALAREDLEAHGVTVVDLRPEGIEPPTVSAVIVQEGDGERTVVSHNAAGSDLRPHDSLEDLVAESAAVLVDGHHPELAFATATIAERLGVPSILDAGSYKAITDDLLPLIDVCACSAEFRLPGHPDWEDTSRALHARGVRVITRTRGENPVSWSIVAGGDVHSGSARPPRVEVRDTLGAGDVWHGALAHGIAQRRKIDRTTLPELIDSANAVAAARVVHRGTRAWIPHL